MIVVVHEFNPLMSADKGSLFFTFKGHRQPQVFAGVQAIGAIFCNTENGANSLHADITTAPTSYRRAIAVDTVGRSSQSVSALFALISKRLSSIVSFLSHTCF